MDKWKESSTSRTFSNKAHKALIENILWTISWSNYFSRVFFFFNFQHDFSETQLKEWHVIWLQNTCQLNTEELYVFPKQFPRVMKVLLRAILVAYYNGLHLYFTFSLIKTKFMNSTIFRNGSGYDAIWFWISLLLVEVWRILPEIAGFLNNIFFAVLLLSPTFWCNHWWIFLSRTST